MERLSISDCRQEKTGSCDGCPVYNLAYLPQRKKALDRVVGNNFHDWDEYMERTRRITTGISKKLCPEGKTARETIRVRLSHPL